jgi:hypothetical protein
MDTITKIIASPATVWTMAVCAVALLSIGLGLFWLFNKQARLKNLADLRKKLDELSPSDPEYSGVRALYTSMVIDAERWGFFHSDSGSGNDAGSTDRSGVGHVSDGSSDGGHH